MCTGFVKSEKKRHKERKKENAGGVENTHVLKRCRKRANDARGVDIVGVIGSSPTNPTNPEA